MRQKAFTVLAVSASMLFSGMCLAQSGLSRQVIGCFGAGSDLNQSRAVAFTGGEAIIGTVASESYVLTQGFHQPRSASMTLFFEITTGPTSCPTSSDGTASVIGITGCTPPYEVSWSNGVSGAQNERLTAGFHTVTVTSADGCERILEFETVADPDGNCLLRFFNAFSPNGDRKNDVWEIENITLPEFSSNSVEIFNRWGQTVWKGSNYNNRDVVWAGETLNGNALPDGTYFFMAEVAGVSHKGYIELTK
ncbi:MAG: gliding motility-associated C-terminal domain-containing protein [Flavobacteriales bacterium]|nr:gliding motility-associated C-terminal domain-containing protein [Flavobacteriales bacterium]